MVSHPVHQIGTPLWQQPSVWYPTKSHTHGHAHMHGMCATPCLWLQEAKETSSLDWSMALPLKQSNEVFQLIVLERSMMCKGTSEQFTWHQTRKESRIIWKVFANYQHIPAFSDNPFHVLGHSQEPLTKKYSITGDCLSKWPTPR